MRLDLTLTRIQLYKLEHSLVAPRTANCELAVLVRESFVRLGLSLAHVELEHRLVARPLHQVFHAVVVPPYRMKAYFQELNCLSSITYM